MGRLVVADIHITEFAGIVVASVDRSSGLRPPMEMLRSLAGFRPLVRPRDGVCGVIVCISSVIWLPI